MATVDYPIYSFGEFSLDLGRGCLMRGPEELKLRPKSFKTFSYLVENCGRLVSKAELIGAVWPDVAVTDDSLVQCLIEIRKALGDSQHYIKTVPRRGYIFTAELNKNGDDPVSAESVPSLAVSIREDTPVVLNENVGAVMKAPSSRKRGLRKYWIIALASAVALVVVMLSVSGIRERLLGNPVPTQIRSLAVLPLKNLSGDPAQDDFVDGMTEALTTELARISSLIVITVPMLHYKGTQKTLPEIARELDVEGLVDGSVVRKGGSVRVYVRMSRGSDGQALWARSYKREIRDILTLQGELAIAITDELKLAQRQSPPAAPTRTVDPEAYDLYVLGRAHWNKRTTEGYRRSIEYYQQALQKDSNLAEAYAGMADSYSLLGASMASDMPASEAAEKARGAALKALELDDTLAEAHAALGRVKQMFDLDWAGAEKEFQRAIDLNPGYVTGYHWYALMLSEIGRPDEAKTNIQRARSIAPLDPNIRRVIGDFLAGRQDYERAIVELRKAIELGPSNFNTHITLGAVFERMGEYREAIAEYQMALKHGGKWTAKAALAHAHAVVGEKAEAEKILQELLDHHTGGAVGIPAVYCGLGRKDEALGYLELLYRDHSPSMTQLLTNWRLDPLRSDPRFKDLLRRVGLPSDGPPEGSQ